MRNSSADHVVFFHLPGLDLLKCKVSLNTCPKFNEMPT